MTRFYTYKNEADIVWAENKKRIELELNFFTNRVKNEVLEAFRAKYQESLDGGTILVLDAADKNVIKALMVSKTKQLEA